jgi:hypothetical protein
MTEVVEGGRLYFPPEDKNKPDERKVMHPETDTDNVLLSDGTTLTQALGGGSNSIVVSDEKPETACLWAKVGSTITVDDDTDEE